MNRQVLTLLALLALLALLGCRRPSPPAPAPAPEPDRAPPPAAVAPAPDDLQSLAGHQYYGVYLSGQKAGWAEEEMQVLPGGDVRMSTHVVLRIQRLGNEMQLELTDEVVYAPLPAGSIRRFAMSEAVPGGGGTVRKGAVTGGALEVTIETGGNREVKSLPIPKETLSDMLPRLVARRLADAGGKPITTWQFDRQALKDFAVETTLASRKATRIQGVPATILEVKGEDKVRGITMVSRITEAGRMLEMTLGPGLKLVLEDKALAQNPAVALPDLYRLSIVPVDRPLGDPALVSVLQLRLDGLPPALSLSDGRQTQDGPTLTIRRRGLEALGAEALSPEDRARWLEQTAFIDYRAPSVAAFAKTAAADSSDVERLRRLTHAVHQSLRYSLATAPVTASRILADRAGDCTEHARLLTAALRALDVPAREVSGLAYSGDSDPGFAFHAWVEAYVDGRWLAADPTWDQVPIDATHVALSRDDPSAIVGLLGGVKAVVIATE